MWVSNRLIAEIKWKCCQAHFPGTFSLLLFLWDKGNCAFTKSSSSNKWWAQVTYNLIRAYPNYPMGDYKLPIKSTNSSTCPIISCLHQKMQKAKTIHSNLLNVVSLILKTSSIPLYFHIVHQMQAGMNSHQSSAESLLPISFQLSSKTLVVCGITLHTPRIEKNMFHKLATTLQWRKICPLNSASWSHIEHLEQICLPFSEALHVLSMPFYTPTKQNMRPLEVFLSSKLISMVIF